MEGQEQIDEKVIKYIGKEEHDKYLKEFSKLIYQLYSEGLSDGEYMEAVRKYRNEHKIYREGDKIKLVKMQDEWTSLKPGAKGYITGFGPTPNNKELQIWVNWETESDLSIIIPVDEIEIMECGQ